MNGIIAFALRMRALMLALFALVMTGGFIAFLRLNIEAYPDPVPPLVDIVTQNPGQSAEEIERYITIPIEVHVATAPYLSAMRTISLFGLSDVKLQFTYDLTYEEAEQRVLNRLGQLPALQNQAQPTISPWSPIGEIYRYQLVGPPGYSVMDLKTLQDWVIACGTLRTQVALAHGHEWFFKTHHYQPAAHALSVLSRVSVAASGCGPLRRKLELMDGQTSPAARLGSPVWKIIQRVDG